MRLLDTTTLGFKEVYNPRDTSYAILSHRWSDEEVSFENFVLAQQPDDMIPPCYQLNVGVVQAVCALLCVPFGHAFTGHRA